MNNTLLLSHILCYMGLLCNNYIYYYMLHFIPNAVMLITLRSQPAARPQSVGNYIRSL
jgi:hypothetical protein